MKKLVVIFPDSLLYYFLLLKNYSKKNYIHNSTHEEEDWLDPDADKPFDFFGSELNDIEKERLELREKWEKNESEDDDEEEEKKKTIKSESPKDSKNLFISNHLKELIGVNNEDKKNGTTHPSIATQDSSIITVTESPTINDPYIVAMKAPQITPKIDAKPPNSPHAVSYASISPVSYQQTQQPMQPMPYNYNPYYNQRMDPQSVPRVYIVQQPPQQQQPRYVSTNPLAPINVKKQVFVQGPRYNVPYNVPPQQMRQMPMYYLLYILGVNIQCIQCHRE